MDGSTNIGTAIGFASGGKDVVVVDLKDVRPAGFGVGMLVGGQQTTMTAAQTDGTWMAGTSTGHWGVFRASVRRRGCNRGSSPAPPAARRRGRY